MSVGTYRQIEAPSTESPHDLILRLSGAYLQAKELKSQIVGEWKRNYRITMNRAAPAIASAPGIRANETYATVDARNAWITDQELDFSITPATDPYSVWAMTAQILGQHLEEILNSIYKTDHWYIEIVKMLWDASMYGAGFGKCVWDAGLEGGLGNVAFKSVSPWCLYIDPFANSLDDAQYIFEVHTMTPQEIERRFPDTMAAQIEQAAVTGDTATDHIPPNQTSSRTKNGALIPVDAGQGPTTWGPAGNARTHTAQMQRGVNVYECWIRENYEEWIEPTDPTMGTAKIRIVTDQWRVVVYSGQTVFVDEIAENLFHTDRHPYVRYVDVENGELWGSPILRDLAPCQMAMNTLLAMAQNNIVFTGNPVMVGVKGSGVERATWKNQPGQIYDVNGGAGGAAQNKPEWLRPPDLPPAMLQMIGFYREEMERIAGLSATQRGEVPSGRATDKQVQAGQEAGFVRIRSSVRNLEVTLSKAGELLANLIILNYDTDRFVAIVGEEGEMSSLRLQAQHFYAPHSGYDGKMKFEPLRFALIVNGGSQKPTSRAARINEAIQLKGMGVVDDQFVLQSFQVSNWRSVLDRKQKQEQMELQLAQAQKEAGQSSGAHRSHHAGGGQPRPA